ncbi:hypothetical protein, partial [Streptomyces sp. SID3343]|uniref:hypothetical protein n=1 Tax=Streptomyces sp. SID3343 TaxID=2690260 RepID=UPI0013C24518
AETPAPPAAADAAAETMQLAKVGEALIPRIDDSDDRHDGYDVYVPPPPPRQAGAGWLLVAALVAIALVGGLLAGVAYQRGRDDDERSEGSSSSSRTPTPAPGDPLAVFASSVRIGACVDFATDGSPDWQPSAPRDVPCEDPAARQRVLARTAAVGGAEDCMNTDGRSRWQPRPGGAALCLERVFHADECVPADVRGDRRFAYLAYLVPCQGPLPKDRAARLRIDEIRPLPAPNTTGCPSRSPVYYPLPSRGQELCMSMVP